MGRLDRFRKKVLDTAPFSLWSTGWPARRALNAVTADLTANFPYVLGEIDFASHSRLLSALESSGTPLSLVARLMPERFLFESLEGGFFDGENALDPPIP
jgi:hypothetical protein